MNFKIAFENGQKGEGKGIPLSGGFSVLSKDINGIQPARYFALASGPKVGKSTAVTHIVADVYLNSLKENFPLDIVYYSLEIDRVSQEFDFCSCFIYRDYGLDKIALPEGVTKDGKKEIEISSDYIRGRVLCDNNIIIKVPSNLKKIIVEVYLKRIVPLFGEHDEKGRLITKDKNGDLKPDPIIKLIETSNNPTGIFNDSVIYASKHNEILRETNAKGNTYVVGAIPKDPKRRTFLILDHVRKLIKERGFNEKENIDKMSEYFVSIKNILKWNIIGIVHLNRTMSDVNSLKFYGSNIYPDSDSIKGTGNMAEDADYVITLFNPNDSKYNLDTHFNETIRDKAGNPLFPKRRTIHLVESRHTAYPLHYVTNMKGGVKNFETP